MRCSDLRANRGAWHCRCRRGCCSVLQLRSVGARDTCALEKVNVTGSNIPRVEAETALPVQIITREDIARSGVARRCPN